MSNTYSPTADWRIQFFGRHLLQRPQDEEAPSTLISTEVALDSIKYDYIALFIGAEYCPHCKAFAPQVQSSLAAFEQKRCKVIFASNDRSKEAFHSSCQKVKGIDIMPYNLDQTKMMRDILGLKTIPALVIFKNDPAVPPNVAFNARHALVGDPNLQQFPWGAQNKSISTRERLLVPGRWWQLGHTNINPEKPNDMYMDEHAVRIRAGLLNIASWLALFNIFYWKQSNFIYFAFPIVSFEFLASANFGLTPIAPVGTIASLMATVLHPEPLWKPARPKVFAWYIGLTMACSCLVLKLLQDRIDDAAFRPAIGGVAAFCNLATWLESSCGFCLGCWMYNKIVVPMFKLERCHECK